jgi:RHS repeat-associated protein
MPTTTNYIWDEENLLAEADGTNAIQTVYTNEPEQYGNLVSTRLPVAGTPTTVYHHFDAIGSTRQLSTNAGSVSDTVVYDAWGNVVTRTGTSAVFLLWIAELGYYFDAESTALRIRALSYSPLVGRWTSPDTLVLPRPFSYSMNSPATFVDPSGKVPVVQPITPLPPVQPVLGISIAPAPNGGPSNSAFPPGHCCGAAYLGIRWTIAGKGASGWILQRVSRAPNVTKCDPCQRLQRIDDCKNCGDPPIIWEAWQVVRGVIFRGAAKFVSPDAPVGAGNPLNDFGAGEAMDTFSVADESFFAGGPVGGRPTLGTVKVSGTAWFIPNYVLKMPPWINPLSPDKPPSTGDLPTFVGDSPPGMTIPPGPGVQHSLSSEWNCCGCGRAIVPLRPLITAVINGTAVQGQVKECQ